MSTKEKMINSLIKLSQVCRQLDEPEISTALYGLYSTHVGSDEKQIPKVAMSNSQLCELPSELSRSKFIYKNINKIASSVAKEYPYTAHILTEMNQAILDREANGTFSDNLQKRASKFAGKTIQASTNGKRGKSRDAVVASFFWGNVPGNLSKFAQESMQEGVGVEQGGASDMPAYRGGFLGMNRTNKKATRNWIIKLLTHAPQYAPLMQKAWGVGIGPQLEQLALSQNLDVGEIDAFFRKGEYAAELKPLIDRAAEATGGQQKEQQPAQGANAVTTAPGLYMIQSDVNSGVNWNNGYNTLPQGTRLEVLPDQTENIQGDGGVTTYIYARVIGGDGQPTNQMGWVDKSGLNMVQQGPASNPFEAQQGQE